MFVFGTFEDINSYLNLYTAYLLQYDKAENVESKFAELKRLPGDLNSQETSISYSLKNNADPIACKAEYYHQCGDMQPGGRAFAGFQSFTHIFCNTHDNS